MRRPRQRSPPCSPGAEPLGDGEEGRGKTQPIGPKDERKGAGGGCWHGGGRGRGVGLRSAESQEMVSGVREHEPVWIVVIRDLIYVF